MMEPPRKRRDGEAQLQSLTPLRGIAALWVVLYHYAVIYFPSLHPQTYTQLLGKGYLAVDLFFILSGFVLAHVYREAFTQEVSGNYLKFLFARIARLYPLHLFVLALFLTTALASRAVEYASSGMVAPIPWEGARSLSALVANLFMLQGLKASELSWNYPAWSISVEFMAYLAFPFLVPLIFRAGVRTKVALAIALLTALAWLAFWTKDDFNQWDGPRTLLRCLPEFTAGMLLYDLYIRRSWPWCLQRDWLFLLILGSLLLLLHVGAADLLIILLFPAVVMAAVSNTGYVAGLANTRPLVWLGNISYSLYLIHGFVQFLMTKLLSAVPLASPTNISPITALALTGAMLCASLLLATATYFAVERVGRRYLRNVFGVPTQSTARQLRATEYTDEKMDHERRPGTVQDRNLAT